MSTRTAVGAALGAALLMVSAACSGGVGEPVRSAATSAYRAAHPGAKDAEVQRTLDLADCDYVEVSGSAGVDHMTISRGETPRVLQIATEGAGYFDIDYGRDELNKHCQPR